MGYLAPNGLAGFGKNHDGHGRGRKLVVMHGGKRGVALPARNAVPASSLRGLGDMLTYTQPRTLRRRRPARGLSGLGAAPPVDTSGISRACNPGLKAQSLANAQSVRDAISNGWNKIEAEQMTLSNLEGAINDLAYKLPDNPRMQDLLTRAQASKDALDDGIRQLNGLHSKLSSAIAEVTGRGNCPFVQGANVYSNEWQSWRSAASQIASSAVSAAGVKSLDLALTSIVRQIQDEQDRAVRAEQQAQAAAAAEQQRALQAWQRVASRFGVSVEEAQTWGADPVAATNALLSEERRKKEEQAIAAAEQRAAAEQKRLEDERAAREAAAIAREQAAAQQQADLERYRLEQQAAREEAARQLELQREEQARRAEERRLALEEQRLLRDEERRLREEEREAELRRLTLLQEIAAAGGAAAPLAPGQVPGLSIPGMPGGLVPGGVPWIPGAQPFAQQAPVQQEWSPYGPAPMQFSPQQPSMPAPPAALPQYQQSQGLMPAPGAPPAPGMEWAAFNPGQEMFGMGALVNASAYPHGGAGSLIESGYKFHHGTDPRGGRLAAGQYVMERPDGSWFYVSDREASGEIRDPSSGKVVWRHRNVASGGSGTSTSGGSSDVDAQSIADVLREAIGVTGQVLSERERRKAAERGEQYSASIGPLNLSTDPVQGKTPGWVWGGLGAIAAAGAFAWVMRKKKAE